MKPRAFIGVGSNLAPEANVPRALEQLDAAAALIAISTFCATPALERPSDPAFVNGVVEIEAAAPPRQVKALLRAVEHAVGRRRGTGVDRLAPREIDLDLLLYGDTVSSAPELPLPHPDVTSRRFVALPLLELAPDLVVPGTWMRLDAIARSLPPYPMEALDALTQGLRRRFLGHGCRQG